MRYQEAMKNKIRTLIWDLDNTLYKFDKDGQQERLWHESVVNFMRSQGINVTLEEGMEIAQKGWQEHRNSNHYFIENYGIGKNEAHVGMFTHINQNMIIPCEETPSLMHNMQEYRHVILTYATKEWANKVLNHAGLIDYFQPNMILGAEDYNFEDKAHSARGILTALDRIGGNAEEVLFVEDTLPNLRPAKEEAGVHTVYLHHNRPMNDNDMDFVDLTVQDTPELLKWFKEIPSA